MTHKTNEMLLYAVIFCLIAVGAFAVGTNWKQITQAKAPTLGRVYQANFNGRKCDFCGAKQADFYELSHSRKTGETQTEYLCAECHDFLHYEQFQTAFKAGKAK